MIRANIPLPLQQLPCFSYNLFDFNGKSVILWLIVVSLMKQQFDDPLRIYNKGGI